MSNTDFFRELSWRGYIYQTTNDGLMPSYFTKGPIVTGYAGFDATADSLHIGSLIPILALARLQRAGHRPIAILGGATTMIGDPSGKTEMRKMLSEDEIRHNLWCIQEQIERFVDPAIVDEKRKPLFINNADWLRGVTYIDFLREIGRHFSVNRMLTQDSVKLRMETGISFIEFNYMILQAYDFAVLNKRYDCSVQFGGSDQWGNIVMGIDLCRRMNETETYGLTFPLMTTAGGAKMGKTESGAIWMDAKKLSPYEFYQYWVNVDDRDVIRFLMLYTFMSEEEIAPYKALEGAALREAKQRLAYEVTKLVHGLTEADKAKTATLAAFGGEGSLENVPTTEVSTADLEAKLLVDFLVDAKFVSSKSEGRRKIKEGGVSVGDKRISDEQYKLSPSDFSDGAAMLKLGKKHLHRIVVVD